MKLPTVPRIVSPGATCYVFVLCFEDDLGALTFHLGNNHSTKVLTIIHHVSQRSYCPNTIEYPRRYHHLDERNQRVYRYVHIRLHGRSHQFHKPWHRARIFHERMECPSHSFCNQLIPHCKKFCQFIPFCFILPCSRCLRCLDVS